ncbi:hypothetical protein [Sphaerisporangium corydalis]|uniref:Uncharacterized protein n=1 Tax=Sphaerisporangium corydalis TaxID=1441875 RepID=A0ABV9ERN7_9ACTN|nr:hypothetical protein [Sphaerisporangium corydalis]
MDVNSTVVTQFSAPQFVAFVKAGVTFLRDSRSTATYNLSTVPGYPTGAISVALAPSPVSLSTKLNVTVSTLNEVFQSTCLVQPQPGQGTNPLWPNNCGAFIKIIQP